MIKIAQAYHGLGCYAEVESVATNTKDVLEAAGMTKCYVFARCKDNEDMQSVLHSISYVNHYCKYFNEPDIQNWIPVASKRCRLSLLME